MSDKLPYVSVVLVTKNAEKYLDRCIESLVGLDYPRNRYEVIVIDGVSNDKSLDIIKKYKGVKLFINEKEIIGPGRNLGISVAGGEYIAFTDSDCVVKMDWLKNLVAGILSAENDVVAVGGPNKIFDEDPVFARMVGYSQETFLGSGGSAQSYDITKPMYVPSIPNCNILYKKEVIKKEGYDNRIKIGEDLDLNFRLNNKGYRFLYLPDAVVWHHRRNSFKSFVKNMFGYGEAMIKVSKKNKRLVRVYGLAPVFMLFLILSAYPALLFFNGLVYFYTFLLLVYVAMLGIATFSVLKKTKSFASLLTFLLIPTQHIAYGVGFVAGLFRKIEVSK